ncbi:MAG: 16S rRNA (adenine(1518)-N(6)/adenine(1519)-N(6))-dimethyltransferase RsmA [Polyangiaceae bacterium]
MIDSKGILRRAGLTPKKSFGQNFLVDGNVAEAIARACVPDDEVGRAAVIELGAGAGALTSLLVPRAKSLVAVERDRDLVPLLGESFAGAIGSGTMRVLEADAQGVDPTALLADRPDGSKGVLCGNLPYQITGRLLELAVHHAKGLDRAVFMVQDEVAERLAASPGSKTYGALTVFVTAAFRVTKFRTVPPGCFYPPPDVTSAVVVLEAKRPPLADETETFRAVVRGAFAMRRKTLRNAWAGLGLPPAALADAATAAGVSLDKRGETLSVTDFARMADAVDRTKRGA